MGDIPYHTLAIFSPFFFSSLTSRSHSSIHLGVGFTHERFLAISSDFCTVRLAKETSPWNEIVTSYERHVRIFTTVDGKLKSHLSSVEIPGNPSTLRSTHSLPYWPQTNGYQLFTQRKRERKKEKCWSRRTLKQTNVFKPMLLFMYDHYKTDRYTSQRKSVERKEKKRKNERTTNRICVLQVLQFDERRVDAMREIPNTYSLWITGQ